MTPSAWERVQEVVDAALDLAPSERARYLDDACGGDEEVRTRAEALIRAHDNAGNLLSNVVGERARTALAASSESEAGKMIGRYRIRRLLGEGGMGAVYEAEQEQPRRVVALKVIRPGYATVEMLRRFHLEAEALGRLQHEGIARIHDAGTADRGFGPQPYFAMEFIAGQDLIAFSRENRLAVRQRLELFAKVCDAVEHAHRNGVIHRDLKPGNILVDTAGQPKVLDFGVARVADADLHATQHTSAGQLIGTLAYMSPEQLLADPSGIDTRSDVYSLGVVLYELLAGRLPCDTSGKRIDEAVAAIRDSEPAPLGFIHRMYRGDIDTIVRKALEKDKARRYGAAASLGEDIRRFLRDEPIAARPPTAGYQLRKLARRHRALVAGFAAVFLVLIAGVLVSTWQAIRAGNAERTALQQRDQATASEAAAVAARGAADRARERAVAAERQAEQQRNSALEEKHRADTERESADAVSAFLRNDVLAQSSARTQNNGDHPDPELKVRAALDRAAKRIEGMFPGKPVVEASIRLTIGESYLDLGLGDAGQAQIERSIALRRSALGERHPDTIAAEERLGMAYARVRGRYPEAEQILTRITGDRRRLLGDQHIATRHSMGNLATAYIAMGKYAQAEQLLSPLVATCRRVVGEEHPETMENLTHLATVYTEEGKYAQAQQIEIRLLAIYGARQSEGYAAMLVMNNLANSYDREGNYRQAEPLFVRTVELARTALGAENPTTLLYENNLADLERKTGRVESAERRYHRVLDARTRILGDENPDTLITMMSLARLYRATGLNDKATQVFIRVIEVRRRVLGEQHPNTLNSIYELALTREREGRFIEEEVLAGQVAEGRRRLLGQRHPATLAALLLLGRSRVNQGKYWEAEAVLRECLAGNEQTAPGAWQRFQAQAALGASLAGKREFEEAERLLIGGYQGMSERRSTIPADEQSALEQARKWLGGLYENSGKLEKPAFLR